jgi:hypothetical protein
LSQPNMKWSHSIALFCPNNLTMTFHSTFTPLRNTPYISPSPKGVRTLKWIYIRHYLMYDYFVQACSSPPSSSSPYLCSPFNMHPRELMVSSHSEAHPQAKKGYIYSIFKVFVVYSSFSFYTLIIHGSSSRVCVESCSH